MKNYVIKIKICKYLIILNIALINSFIFLTNSRSFPRKIFHKQTRSGIFYRNKFLSNFFKRFAETHLIIIFERQLLTNESHGR
mgnify:CR=1 FL=1